MKKIPLTQGQFAIVDDEDYDRLSEYKWRVNKSGRVFYAVRDCYLNKKRESISMARSLVCPDNGMEVDHINRNPLDNRRNNIRVCTRQENSRNRGIPAHNTSGYKGVRWHNQANKWMAVLGIDGKLVYFGFYTCIVKAAKAHDAAAREHFGEFACLNFPRSKNE